MFFASYCPVLNHEINNYLLAVEAPACQILQAPYLNVNAFVRFRTNFFASFRH